MMMKMKLKQNKQKMKLMKKLKEIMRKVTMLKTNNRVG